MNSLLRLVPLLNLICLSTTGLVVFGLPSPRLHPLKSSSSGGGEATDDNKANAKANAFESIVRNVSKNKDCALVIYVHINAFLDTKYHTHALSSQINLETFLKK